jgi:hypothetical protein
MRRHAERRRERIFVGLGVVSEREHGSHVHDTGGTPCAAQELDEVFRWGDWTMAIVRMERRASVGSSPEFLRAEFDRVGALVRRFFPAKIKDRSDSRA